MTGQLIHAKRAVVIELFNRLMPNLELIFIPTIGALGRT